MAHLSYSAVFPLIISSDGKKILLHRRQNTGYMDGFWDTAGSGHVDAGESAQQAAARESREELGIEVAINQLEFAHVSHNIGSADGRTYYHLYFWVRQYQNIPTIMEPDKIADLRWFPFDELPDKMISIRRHALEKLMIGEKYSENFE